MAGIHQGVEGLTLSLANAANSKIVNDDQILTYQLSPAAFVLFFKESLQSGKQFVELKEAYRSQGPADGVTEDAGQVGFTGARRTGNDHSVVLVNKTATGQLPQQSGIQSGGQAGVKVFQTFRIAEASMAEQSLEFASLAQPDLFFEQQGEKPASSSPGCSRENPTDR